MAVSKNDQIERANEELSVLDGVIDYADRMIYQEGQGEYISLRRHAYGKTVVIETEKEGIKTFRLSSTPVVYPKCASGYATPHSPVGRLCSFLKPGDEDETPRWGEYRVVEVRLFDRFDGPLFEPNVRNFLRMGIEGDLGKAQVSNLRSFLNEPAKTQALPEPVPVIETIQVAEHELKAAPEERKANSAPRKANVAAPSAEPVEDLPPPSLAVDSLAVVEEDDEGLLPTLELDDESVPGEQSPASAEEYFGLSETFFINRTREQDEVISRSPIGPMFVEGVAGSGKTSAALGRTKMLCDFDANSLVSESEFREIAGENLDYWAATYAGQFSQEGSVGFVRTGELIQYLKETCRRLDLPHLPVQEYPELRSKLRQHRRVDRNRAGSPRWAGMPTPRSTHADTTMAWLKAADRVLAAHWSRTLVAGLPTAEQIAAGFTGNDQALALRIATVVTEQLRSRIAKLAKELSRSVGEGGFALDGLAEKIQVHIQQVRQEVLGQGVLWVIVGDRAWAALRERDLAKQLVKDSVPLYLRSSARLVFVGKHGPTDEALTLLSTAGEPLPWSEETRALLDQGQVLVRDPNGLTVPAKASDATDLYLRLLPEATERLYVLRDGALRKLSLSRGLGKARLTLTPKPLDSPTESEDEEALQPADSKPPQVKETQRSVDSLFTAESRRTLLEPLTFLAEAYSDALAAHSSQFPDTGLASRISEQLQARKLAEEDIDLLLCLAHIIGRGFSGTPPFLSEPPFYQAVFVDEVQDFTEQQIFLMVEQARPEYRAITVVGDIAQKLHNGSMIDILACFPGKSVPRVQLTENLRQLEAPGLAWFTACFRAELQDGLTGHEPSEDLRARMQEHADRLRGPDLLLIDDEEELREQVIETLKRVRPGQTAAVILGDPKAAAAFFDDCKTSLVTQMVEAELSEKIDLSRRHVRHFTSVTHAKGLEFDFVIVPHLERYDLNNPIHINRLYVALTRARRKLVILSNASHSNPLFDSVWGRYESTLALI